MKKLMMICVAMTLACGCSTVDVFSSGSLYAAMNRGFHPNKGDRFTNHGNMIKVFQVCHDEKGSYALACVDEAFDDEHVLVRIDSDVEYVSDEFLLPGVYEYAGAYTYETAPIIDGVKTTGTKTARVFKFLPMVDK